MWNKFLVDDGCWFWTAGVNSDGYGSFCDDDRRTKGAHRVLYEILRGPLPEGMTLDHQCHNADESCPGGPTCRHRRCVNPGHLEPVPNEVNSSRGRSHWRTLTHCVKGHPFDEENTYIPPGEPNHRQCRQCKRDRKGRTLSASIRLAGG